MTLLHLNDLFIFYDKFYSILKNIAYTSVMSVLGVISPHTRRTPRRRYA